MPQKINMNLNTNNYSSVQYTQYMESLNRLQKAAAAAQPNQTSLKTAMIGRIHNVRPGCGSCGK
jgi:hypothetical protein